MVSWYAVLLLKLGVWPTGGVHEERHVFSHHKTGHVLAHRLVEKMNEGHPTARVTHGGTWFGQGLDENVSSYESLEAYFEYRCLNCFGGSLAPTSRVVDAIPTTAQKGFKLVIEL